MVMRLFAKMLSREIKNIKGQFISILVIIAIGISFFTGLNSTLRNLKSASELYFNDYKLAHLCIYFSKTPENVLDRIIKIPGVAKATGRVVQDVKLDPAQANILIRLITLPDSKKPVVNDILLKSGRYFTADSPNQCLVEEAFFKANGLKLGDYLCPIINGNKAKLKIIGVVKSPEYIYQLRDGNELFPNPRKFGIAYLKQSYGQLLFNFSGSINEASILLSKPAEGPEIQERLKYILKNQGLKEIIPRQDQLSYNTFSNEIEQLTSFGSVFPMMFLIVAALITYITMSRLVENQRTQIGTLKALGYNNLTILAYYLSFAVVMGIVGSIAGSILGQYFSKLMIHLYNGLYQLPLEEMKPQYDLIIPASLLALVFGLMAGLTAVKSELRLAPAESMRSKAPKAGQKTFIENIGILWQSLNFSWKIILRNLFRYKKRVAFTAVGIILATALLLTALGMNDSIDYLIDQQFTGIQQYDLKVNLNQSVNVNALSYFRSLPHVTRVEPMVEMSMELYNGWRTKKMGLTVLTPQSELYRVTNQNGARIPLPDQGILLPEKFCRLLDLGVGDKANFRIIWPGKQSEQDQKEIVIKGKATQYVGASAYGSMSQVNRFFDEGPIANVILLKLDDHRHETAVVSRITELNTVGSVQSKAESLYSLQQALESTNSMVAVFIIAAGALAFAVIYNIANINIHERRRELATLKVLGFTEKEMKQLIFNENFIVTFMGVLAGFPLGGAMLEGLMESAATENMTLPAILFPQSYLWTFGLMFGFTVFANLVLSRKIRIINMVEALKSSE
jgi:putative ABC transport system permease protein